MTTELPKYCIGVITGPSKYAEEAHEFESDFTQGGQANPEYDDGEVDYFEEGWIFEAKGPESKKNSGGCCTLLTWKPLAYFDVNEGDRQVNVGQTYLQHLDEGNTKMEVDLVTGD
ncbi:MAG: hypothetical protein Q9176_004351 [Flavoplaca citrina]